jgi:hypothetical protein
MTKGPVKQRAAHMRVLWRKVGIKPGDLPKDGFKKAEMMGMYNPRLSLFVQCDRTPTRSDCRTISVNSVPLSGPRRE